jgi:hypothetical protein
MIRFGGRCPIPRFLRRLELWSVSKPLEAAYVEWQLAVVQKQVHILDDS